MLSREATGSSQCPRKIDVYYWRVPHRMVNPIVKYSLIPFFRVIILPVPPQMQYSREAGWDYFQFHMATL